VARREVKGDAEAFASLHAEPEADMIPQVRQIFTLGLGLCLGAALLVSACDAGLPARTQSDRLIVSFTVVDGTQPPSVAITPAH